MTIAVDLSNYEHYNSYYEKSKSKFPIFESYKLNCFIQDHKIPQLGRLYRVCGRILYKRNFGALSFYKIEQNFQKYQILFKVEETENYQLSKNLTRGDYILVEGISGLSKTNEFTIFAKRFALVAKTFFEHPDKVVGIKDPKLIAAKRYLYMLYNEDFRKALLMRSNLFRTVREFLNSREILEFDMPTLEKQYGGAAARPFTTSAWATKHQYYLSIAPELKLKQLLFAGFSAIYSLTHNYRNEGIDNTHHPEFAALEIYVQNEDYRYMIRLIQELVTTVTTKLIGKQTIITKSGILDFSKWKTVTYDELLDSFYAIKRDSSLEKIHKVLKQNALPILNKREECCFLIFDKLITPNLIQPTCVIEYPAISTPLAKRCKSDSTRIEQCEVYIAGMEFANIYSEENSITQLTKNIEIYKSVSINTFTSDINAEFVEMLGYGMPLSTGGGIGMQRWLMLLTGMEDISNVIPFVL